MLGLASCVMLALACWPLSTHAGESAAPTLLDVDAREASRGILKVHLRMPVTPGPLTLVYPKWLPGRHGPAGPITNLAGPTFSHDGVPVEWRRDDVDMYAFHLQVPAGVKALDADFEVVTGLRPDGTVNGLEAPRTATQSLLILEWHQVVLYPDDSNTDELRYQARLRLPDGWSYATALSAAAGATGNLSFEPTSLTTLIDSTLIAGRYFQSFDLGGAPRCACMWRRTARLR